MSTDNTETVSAEVCLARLRALDTEREDVIRRQAVLQERYAAAVRELEGIVREMEECGTSPQTIVADLAAIEDQFVRETTEYTAALAYNREQLDLAEQALQQLA